MDPSAIKRDKKYELNSAEQGKDDIESLEEFERIQKIYDSVMLQEELKQTFQENIRYKAKIKDIEDTFKFEIEEKAAAYKKFEAA